MIRVLICDDSALVRGVLGRLLGQDPLIRVVGAAANGEEALAALAAAGPERMPHVVLLDLEMPVMDGMTALPLLLRHRPQPAVIVASALTQQGAAATMAALRAGAVDYIAKPVAERGGIHDPAFRAELLAKVKGWARLGRPEAASVRPRRPAVAMAARPPRVLAIAASTGGPQALAAFIRRLPPRLPVPVLVVQHMPAGFTAMLAQHLGGLGALPAAEAREGEAVLPGRIYIAPGDRHMLLRGPAERATVLLTRDPPVHFCRPAADPLFASLPPIYADAVLAVVLTGMGQDGQAGAAAITAAGGVVFAQDEATSVVGGMPGAVVRAGHARLQGPPELLAEEAVAMLRVPA
ncbi:MAG: chemotaxis-specific protein-glutamate methyltransferase CheB [Rhodovarius sp.]|nr:chemotaxis-specific protein-glutamate methyltransferase CheB [Rhodovarius sp.]